jgi:hypothetical protein
MSGGALYHFSEEPGIEMFEPRGVLQLPEVEPLVWAIDEWHAPMYFFPRECPRILLWPLATTSEADRQRWFGASEARMLAHVEYGWLERMRSVQMFRYEMPSETFKSLDDAGMFVSREAVRPIGVEAVGDLFKALRDSGVELRVLKALAPLRGAWGTTLHASGIRLRNAAGWELR